MFFLKRVSGGELSCFKLSYDYLIYIFRIVIESPKKGIG